MGTTNLAGLGFTLKTQADNTGQRWFWELKRMGRVVGHGFARTELSSERSAMELFMKLSKKGTKRKNIRGNHRKRLKDLCERRPYLVAHVTLEALRKTPKADMAMEAEQMEQFFYEADPPNLRVPLPTHKLTLPAHEQAKRLWDSFLELGMLWKNPNDEDDVRPTKKLKTWAINTFGNEFLKENEING